jgi:diguanylate cyclase (GGDEF)-like protein/PAS domain S-box-containing protein
VTAETELSSGDQLRNLIAQLSDGVLVVDEYGSLLFLNPAAEHMLGRPAADLLGENIGFPMVAGAPAVELELVTSDGADRIAEMQVAEVEWDGQPAFVASLRDVTQRKRLEERYRRTSQTLEAIVEASPLPVIQLGPDFSTNFWNRAADALFAEPDQLARGLPLPIARDPKNQELFRVPERLGRGEGGVRVEAVYDRAGGEPLQLAVFVSALRDREGAVVGMVAILEEITDRKRVEVEAREDPLTGVANRRVLMRELEAAIERARAGWPGAVLLLDIDGFKEVNDTLGHHAGDKLLAELAQRLEEALRPGDLLARYGGDELVVIPARATLEEAQWIGERLRACIDGVSVGDGSKSVSLSIGIVAIDGSLDAEGALQEADRALYEAKRQGRNRVVIRRLEGS